MTKSVSKLPFNLASLANRSAKYLKLPLDRFNTPARIGLYPRNQKQEGSLLYILHNVVDLRNGFLACHLIAVCHGGISQELSRNFKAMANELYQQLLLSKATTTRFQKERVL